MKKQDFLHSISNSYSESEKSFLFNYIEKEKPYLSYIEIIDRLNNLEPIDYILGYTYFYGLKIQVDSSTLIPRPETEELVEMISKDNAGKKDLTVLEVGTGSGCIAITIMKNLSISKMDAVDVSKSSLDIAEMNAKFHALKVNWFQMDFLDESNWTQLGNYDIIVSNPPYISRAEADALAPSVLKYEPAEALFVEDSDNLLFYKKILQFASTHLNKSGFVYFETHQDYQLGGFKDFDIQPIRDLSQNNRFLRCKFAK